MDVRTPLFQNIACVLIGVLFLNPIVSVAAELTLDAQAGGNTSLGQAGNGVPIVNIATPNGSGLSHNKFSDYNVGQQGLILNNATSATQGTQLGGIVLGNPNLKGQAAGLILNEVTGANASQLKGYTEVAGKSAAVIVANPHGITCDGCGFINTPRVTLTTGKPMVENGRLDSFDVDDGQITIEGAGLNASNVDQFDLITRSAKLNAELYAKQLNVIAGRNQVKADDLSVTAKAAGGSAKPQLAIDSSALGGMYAGAIRLVGSEAGVGVKLAGDMAASAGDIQIDANGQLNVAQMAASRDIRLKAKDLELTGKAYAAGSIEAQADEGLSLAQGQSLAAGERIELQGGELDNQGLIEAGVNADNSRNLTGDVHLRGDSLRNSGTVLASRELSATLAAQLDNRAGSLSAKARTAIDAASLNNSAEGRVLSQGTLAVSVGELDNQTGLIASGKDLSISTTAGLNNQTGEISSQAAATLNADQLDNRTGLIAADSQLNLNAAKLDNSAQGTLSSQGGLTARVTGKLDNHGEGALISQGALSIQAQELDNSQGGLLSSRGSLTVAQAALNNQGGVILADQHLSLAGQSLDNSNGGLISGKADVGVAVTDLLDNRGQGTLVADGKLTVGATELRNGDRGQVAAKGDLEVSVDSLSQQGDATTQAGELLSQGKLSLSAGSIDNRQGGLIAASQGLDVRASNSLRNSGGEISTQGQAKVQVLAAAGQPAALLDNSAAGTIIGDQGLVLTVQRLLNNAKGLLSGRDSLLLIGGSLDNSDSGTLSSQHALSVELSGALDNQNKGALISGGNLAVSATSLNNSAAGLLSSGGQLDVSNGSLNNQGGKLVSDGQLSIANSNLDNSYGGVISAKQALSISTGQLDNQHQGVINGAAGLTLAASQLNNHDQGLIAAKGAAQITASGLDQHQGGELISETALTLDLQGGELNNSQAGLIATPGALLLNNLGKVDNSAGGEISSAQSFLLKASVLNNSAGRIISGQDLQLQITQALLNNLKGVLSAAKLSVAAASLDNSAAGVLASKDDLQLSITGKLDNHDQGLISAGQALIVESAALDNSEQGLLASGGALQLTTGAANNQGGSIASQTSLTATTGDLDNRGGVLSSQQALTLNAAAVDNRDGGLITSAAGLSLTANSLDSSCVLGSSGGEVSAKQDLILTVAKLIQRQGRLIGEAGVRVDLQGGDLDNRGGLLSATGPLTLLNLRKLDNRDAGEVSSSQSYSLVAGTIDNGEMGRLISAGTLNLDLGEGSLRNAGGGLVSGWQGLTLKAGNLDNSALGTLSSRDGALKVELSGSERVLNNSGAGALVSKGKLEVDAASLNNSGQGILSSEGDLRLNLAGKLDNRGGLIDTQGTLNASAGEVDNHAGQISSQQAATLTAASLDNSAGQLSSAAALTLTLTGQLTNTQQAKLASAGPLLLKAQAIDNQGGSLISQNLLSVIASSLNNANGGTLAARNGLSLLLSGALNNSADGLIHSEQGSLDIQAQSLNNNGGALSSQQDLTVSLDGKLDNQSGRLESLGGNLDLQQSSAIDNSGGVLRSLTGWLKLLSAGLFDNDAGTTQAQALEITAQGIDNRAGHLSALSGDSRITATGSTFNNQGGGLYAHQLLKLIAGDFNNQGSAQGLGGKVAAGQIDFGLSAALNNNHGILESGSTLTLAVASLDNQQGSLRALGSSGDTRIDAAALDNRSGTIETANSNLTLNVASLQSSGGSILHVGSGNFGLSAAQVMGAGGDLSTNGLLSLTADSWTNSGTLQAGQLVLNIGSFTQTASGKLLAGQSFSGTGANWVNQGLLASDGDFSLNLSGAYSGNGQITSLGDLSLSAGSIDLSSSARITGGGLTTVNASGLLSNSGKLTSAGDLTVRANTLNNLGTLGSAEQLRLYAPTLLNQNGLIFSGEDMALRVDNFTNRYADVYSLGGLSITKDDQLARASAVENISATLESTGDMRINAQRLDNRTDVYSLGRELVSGYIAVRCYDCSGDHYNVDYVAKEFYQGSVLDDSPSAFITVGGNFNFTGGDLFNRQSSISGAGNIEIQAANFSNVGAVGGSIERTRIYNTGRVTDGTVERFIGDYVTPYNQRNNPDFPRLYYVDGSGNIRTAVVGTKMVTVKGDPREVRILVDSITRTELHIPHSYNLSELPQSQYDPNNLLQLPSVLAARYALVSDVEVATDGGEVRSAIVQAGGNVSIQATQNLENGVIRQDYLHSGGASRVADTAAQGTGKSTVAHLNPQLPPDLQQQQVNPLTLPGFSLPQGENGLFRLSGQSAAQGAASAAQGATGDNTLAGSAVAVGAGLAAQGPAAATGSAWNLQSGPGAGNNSGGTAIDAAALQIAGVQSLPSSVRPSTSHKYLIETNPELTNLKQFLSSDYMLGNLGYDPDTAQKRLGDGLYEQRLIREAVVARTGQRFLAGLTSNEAMFRYLMDNAIASKTALNLSVGITLTAEQVAALTHDLVWLEEHEVNGEKVLVPVLYLAQAEGRLAPNGALIQGRDITLISGGDLLNQGTLRASNNLSAAAAGSIGNSGLIAAGNRLDLLATDSIRNAQGGIIAGRDVSLTTVNGDVLNERTVTRHDAQVGNRRSIQDYVDSAARIEATNSLSISAGRDVANRGGVLDSRGDLSIDAGRDVSITSVEERSMQARGSKYRNERVSQHGAQVSAGRDIEISAGRDLTAVASQIEALRDISLMAGQDVTLAAAANEDHFYSKGKKVTRSTDTVRQQGTVVQAGRDIAIAADEDLTLVASQVKAGNNVELDAEQDINILSAKDESASFYLKKSKGSFGRSKSKQKEKYDSTNVASVIEAGNDLSINTTQAADGSLSIDGGRDVTVIGSQLKVGNDLLVGATGDIAVLSGVEEHGSYSKKTKSGFLGLSKSGKSQLKTKASQVASELEAGNDVVIAAGNDIRLRASETTAGNDVELRAGLVTDTGDINLVSANDTAYSRSQEYKKSGPSISGGMISYASAQKSGQIAQSSTSVGSQVTAERDASLNAERDINIVGSGVSAGRNVTLGAGRDVNVVAASNSSMDKVWEQEARVGMALGMQVSSRYTPEEERIYFGTTHIAGEQTVRRDTQTVAPSLVQSGDALVVDAGRDIQVKGSQLLAGGDASLDAGRDIRVVSSTQSRVLSETDKTQTLGGGILKSPAKGPMGFGFMADGDYLDGHNRSTSQAEIYSAISAEGDLSLKSGRDTEIAGGNLVADSVAIDAGRDIRIDSPVNKDILYRDVMQGGVGAAAGLRPHEEDAEITSPSIQPSSIVATAGDISLNAGQDVTIQGAALLAQRDVVIEAVRNAHLGGASVSVDNHNDVVSNSMASVDKTNTSFNATASAPLEIQAGRDLRIQAGQDVVARNLLADAGRDIDIIAGRDLTVGATQRERSTGSNSLGIKGDVFGLGDMARAFSEGKSGGEILSAAAQSNPLLNNINNIAKTDEDEDKWQNAAVLAYRLYSNNPAAGSGESTGSNTAASYGFDLSRGINGRLGYQRSQSEWNEQSGSELAAGRDLYLEAGRDLALVDGTQAGAVREAYLVGGRDIIVRSAGNTSKERSSGGGVTVGYNGGWYGGLDANSSRGDSAQYQNASVTAGQTLVTDSGRDTTIIGGNLHGGEVEMSVGRNLALISQQGTIDQQSSSASFTVGSSYSFNASASERDRQAVDRPATITADDRLRIDVAQNTHLKGSQIDSGTGNLALVTETLTYEDLKNHDHASQGSASYSGSSDGDTWGNGGEAQEGGGFSAGVPIANLEGSDTRAAIGEGTIHNHVGENLNTGISRDVAGAHEETDSAAISEYSAKSELLGIAAQEGFEAVGDYANKQALEAEYKATQAKESGNTSEAAYWSKQAESWKEGRVNKVLLHAVVGALLGEASGFGAITGSVSAAANQTLNGYVYEFLKEQGVVQGDDPQNKKIISELTALVIGGAVGGSTGTIGGGASIALHGDKYNRQLHPFELEALKKLAREEAYSPESALTEQQWFDKLLLQALRQVDSDYAAQLGADDPLAQVVLGRINISVTDEDGRTIQLFQGGDAFENHARYAEYVRYSTDDYDRALSSWVKDRASKTPNASAALIMVLNAYRDGGQTESADARVRVIDYLLSVKPEIVYAFAQTELAKQEASNRGDRIAAAEAGRELKELKTVLDETLLTSLNKAKSDGVLPADLQDMNLRVLSDVLSIDSIMQTWAEGRVDGAIAANGYNSYGSLPQGSASGVRSATLHAANDIRFSQNTVSFNKTDRVTGTNYTYNDLVQSMRNYGWKGDPVDVVKMPDGKLTSMDNTRIIAAREAGVKVKATVRGFDDPLTPAIQEARGWQSFRTWGEAIVARINKQSGEFSTSTPYGSSDLPRVTGGDK